MDAAIAEATAQVAAFCAARAHEEMELGHAVRGRSITIVERRPPWDERLGHDWTRVNVAQLRYDHRAGLWSLYAPGRGERWLRYDSVTPACAVSPLLDELADDPTGIFWG